MKFLGRKNELKKLEDELGRDHSFVVVYGRRRVGKTTMIKHFIEDKHALYFLANEEGDRQNLNSFTAKLADFVGQPYLRYIRFERWQEALRAFATYRPEQKKILVIDEFQYLVSSNAAFVSVFQEIWDEILSKASVMVILCGSLISMMTSQVLSHNSPLYGRRTAQIRLAPLGFLDLQEAFGSQSFEQQSKLYAVTGGVPKYVEFFANDRDLWENVKSTVFDKCGFLYEEPKFLLQGEVREPVNYFSIMKAIAWGNHKLSQMASVLELKSTSLSPYLATLLELNLIEKRVPVTEQNPEKSKKGLYYICDHFIDFWFQFVYPYRGELELDNIAYVMDKLDEGFVERHVSFVFEDISREVFAMLCQKGKIDFVPSKLGAYWDAHTQIDVVAVDNDRHRIFAGECKYYEKPVGAEVYFELVKKCAVIKDFEGYELVYGIFSKSGFERRLLELGVGNPNLCLIDQGRLV